MGLAGREDDGFNFACSAAAQLPCTGGCSGGAVFDDKGEFVGTSTANDLEQEHSSAQT